MFFKLLFIMIYVQNVYRKTDSFFQHKRFLLRYIPILPNYNLSSLAILFNSMSLFPLTWKNTSFNF